MRARTALVNTPRGLAKSYGERLRGCNVRNMNPKKADGLSPELQAALEPLLTAAESLSEQIREYNQRIDSGWGTFHVRGEEGLDHALWLMRLSYLRYALKKAPDPCRLLKQESEELGLDEPTRPFDSADGQSQIGSGSGRNKKPNSALEASLDV